MKIDKRAAVVATAAIGAVGVLAWLSSKYPVLPAVFVIGGGFGAIWFGVYLLAKRP